MGTLAVTLLIVLGVAAAAALAAWWRARSTAEQRTRAAEDERQRLERLLAEQGTEAAETRARLRAEAAAVSALREDRERLETELRERAERQKRQLADLRSELETKERTLERERSQREHSDHWRHVEHKWNEELRARLAELHAQRGPLGDTSDVRALVLRTAITLLEAEKGLLLSREDLDSDGDLDLVCGEGFEHDPQESAVAQHFARLVIARDETVRARNPDELELRDRGPADEEIENLVAIPIYLHDRFSGVVVCANKEGGFSAYDDDILLALGDQAGAALHNARLRGEVRGAYLATVRVLADAIEAKDTSLRGHSNEVSAYVASVADRIGLEPTKREGVIFASLLHDIGKLGISERILLKPAELSPEERAIVELHPRIGARLVEQVPALREIGPAVLHHHERWDGTGYPARLRGEEIPLEARLIGIADAFSAMTADRPFRRARPLDDACEELKRCAGSQFDPGIVRLFVEELKRRPPEGKEPSLASALAHPELAFRRGADEPLLGFGAFSAIDNLTLLYSHRYLHDLAHAEAQRAALQGRPFATILVELTRLPEINRESGYGAGDEAIQAVAEVVRRVAGRSGGTAARYSGRRICLLVPGADEPIAEQLADELAAELAGGRGVRLSAAAWRKGESGDDVVARARAGLLATPVATEA